jgi:hypothetical protein
LELLWRSKLIRSAAGQANSQLRLLPVQCSAWGLALRTSMLGDTYGPG